MGTPVYLFTVRLVDKTFYAKVVGFQELNLMVTLKLTLSLVLKVISRSTLFFKWNMYIFMTDSGSTPNTAKLLSKIFFSENAPFNFKFFFKILSENI